MVTPGLLVPYQQYPIVHSECINTRYGQNFLLGILDSPTTSVNIFLPKRYGDVLSEDDLQVINTKRVALYLIYKVRVLDQAPTSWN